MSAVLSKIQRISALTQGSHFYFFEYQEQQQLKTLFEAAKAEHGVDGELLARPYFLAVQVGSSPFHTESGERIERLARSTAEKLFLPPTMGDTRWHLSKINGNGPEGFKGKYEECSPEEIAVFDTETALEILKGLEVRRFWRNEPFRPISRLTDDRDPYGFGGYHLIDDVAGEEVVLSHMEFGLLFGAVRLNYLPPFMCIVRASADAGIKPQPYIRLRKPVVVTGVATPFNKQGAPIILPVGTLIASGGGKRGDEYQAVAPHCRDMYFEGPSDLPGPIRRNSKLGRSFWNNFGCGD